MSTDERTVLELLHETQFLQKLSAGDLDKVAAIASIEHVEPSTVLYQEGVTCQMLYLVSSGIVALDMCMPRQGCTRILTVGPGEIIGWSALLENATMTARATAMETCTLLGLPAAELRQLCDADHDIGYAIMKQVSVALWHRLLATRVQMLDVFGETQPVPAPDSPTSAFAS